MRLWSLHPSLLDPKGLVALWRESLLAQKVLLGQTRGYKHHPQLLRFIPYKDQHILGAYLFSVFLSAQDRGYRFDRSKIADPREEFGLITVTQDQLSYELEHLKKKVKVRDTKWYANKLQNALPEPHPLFTVTPGPVEPWEICRNILGPALNAITGAALQTTHREHQNQRPCKIGNAETRTATLTVGEGGSRWKT